MLFSLTSGDVITFQVSRNASLEMSDGPAMSAETPTAANTVSMFQTSSLAIKATRHINWEVPRQNAAAAVLTNVAY